MIPNMKLRRSFLNLRKIERETATAFGFDLPIEGWQRSSTPN
jgi:hypothetical protein